jgi:hypothetical protein
VKGELCLGEKVKFQTRDKSDSKEFISITEYSLYSLKMKHYFSVMLNKFRVEMNH